MYRGRHRTKSCRVRRDRYAAATFTAVAVAFGLCAGCGGKVRQSGANAAAGAGNAPDASAPDAHAGSGGDGRAGACGNALVPKVHRATAQACPTTRGSVQTLLPDMTKCTSRAGIACTKDADCTAGKNGRCFSNDSCDTVCSYDECMMDSDCAAGPCLCRSSNSALQQNECLPGSNCKTDADCSGGCGYCSPSAVPDPSDCTIGTLNYDCHTASDECLEQNACGDGSVGAYCAYDAGVARWGCGLCVPFPHP